MTIEQQVEEIRRLKSQYEEQICVAARAKIALHDAEADVLVTRAALISALGKLQDEALETSDSDIMLGFNYQIAINDAAARIKLGSSVN